jgi:arsenite methyltransferase
MLQFDAETSRRLEASYLTPDVVEQRRVLLERLALRPGDDVLDIGAGPGFLALDMAAIVGPGGAVHGIDPSENMRQVAATRARPPDAAPVTFSPGEATALPFPDGSFDVVTSTQVYEYVADMPAALAEAHRVLRPGGRLLVLDTDWDSIVWHSSDPDRMRRVLAVWDEHLVDPHLPRRLTGQLAAAGFAVTHRSAISLFNAGYDENTYSAKLIGFVSAFVPGRGGLSEDDVHAWAHDLTSLGNNYYFSLNRYLFLAAKQP